LQQLRRKRRRVSDFGGAAVSIRVEGQRSRNAATFPKALLEKGETMSIETAQSDNANPVQLRSSTPLGTLVLRFVGLLFLAVAVLTLVYSR
jgi:hypothetical protein